FDGCFIGFVGIAKAHSASRGDGGVFDDAQKFQAELLFHAGRPPRRLILGQRNANGREERYTVANRPGVYALRPLRDSYHDECFQFLSLLDSVRADAASTKNN